VVIRTEQIKAFAKTAERRFENDIVMLLKGIFPRVSSKLGETGLREVIQHGIARACLYGIVRERDVGRYIAIMMMFGPDFDTKPNSGPLYNVLRDPRLTGSRLRSDALCQAALIGLRIRARRIGRKPVW
jgi:hypothetical protein